VAHHSEQFIALSRGLALAYRVWNGDVAFRIFALSKAEIDDAEFVLTNLGIGIGPILIIPGEGKPAIESKENCACSRHSRRCQ
jgi:hypothetical protein